MTTQWAYLGPEGTFTEQAVLELARGQDVTPVPQVTVTAAIDAVRSGQVDAAVVPMENSVEGTVSLTQDELIHGTEVRITGEVYVPVRFQLLVRPGTDPGQVRRIGSHPHGHAQVRDFLAREFPGAEAVVTTSTAAAAAAVAAGELDAAAAAAVAGERYGLVALAENIGLATDAVTRFVLLRKPAPPLPATGNDRTSIVLTVPNRPGSLLEVLGEIARRGINLTRLESRPTRAMMGEYLFLVDADGHLAEPAMADMLGALVRRGALLRFLGSYPRGQGTVVPPADFAVAQAYADAAAVIGHLRGEDG